MTKETLNEPLTGPFHQHLDKCKWCADHPFDLCPMGRITIQWEANSLQQQSALAGKKRMW